MICVLVATVLAALGYWYLVRPLSYWKKRGVQQGSPKILFGDSWTTIFKRKSFAELVQSLYTACPNVRYSGIYQLYTPTLLIRDPALIKRITVEDFDHFVDHRSFVAEDIDPLWAKNLFFLKGQKWRDMRSTLSPAFTSNKTQQMFSLISEVAEKLNKFFTETQEEEVVVLEMKDTFSRFANDVIATAAFGVECDSLREPKNEFYLMGKDATDFGGFRQTLKLLGYMILPSIYKICNIGFFSRSVRNFFTDLVKENIAKREEHGIVRPDMIQLLLEARHHGLKYEESRARDAGFAAVEESEIGKTQSVSKAQLTDIDITAQALIFFFAGFDSVSSLMCFMSHELGVNPEIQQKLCQEIDETSKECKGKITYEALLRMKYLDMVISETLRKWPAGVFGDRVCTKPYTIEPLNSDEKPVEIAVDDLLWIPIYALHRDPEYFPEPERFDPERFNDENKGKIQPYTYLPFGAGPRNCIASRFALLETKLLFFYILSNFEIIPVEKTQIPLKLSKKSFNLTAEKGFWLGFKRRAK